MHPTRPSIAGSSALSASRLSPWMTRFPLPVTARSPGRAASNPHTGSTARTGTSASWCTTCALPTHSSVGMSPRLSALTWREGKKVYSNPAGSESRQSQSFKLSRPRAKTEDP